jgi:hypothetical protein
VTRDLVHEAVTTQVPAIEFDIEFDPLRGEWAREREDDTCGVNHLKGYSIVRAIRYTDRKT